MAGNARFHNKWHRRNHHSQPSPGYPDSANDPIASPEEPFWGDFYLKGTLSAQENLWVDKNATIKGNLSVLGDFSYIDTIVSITSALSVVNHGTGPALTVVQYGEQPIARFVDGDAPGGPLEVLYLDNNGDTIFNGKEPAYKFDYYTNSVSSMRVTVNGNLYSNKGVIWERPDGNTVYVSITGSDLNSGLNRSQKVRTIKKACQIVFNRYGTNKATIQVEAGDYTEKNPIYVPAGTSIIGEAYLRRTTVRPYNRQMDIFWLNNACYLWGFTFRDSLEPCASTAFPNLQPDTPAYKVAFNTPGYEIDVTKPGGPFGLPIVSKPYIVTSPYTQGMSTITSYLKVPIQPDLYPSYVTPDSQVTIACVNSGFRASKFIEKDINVIANGIEDLTTLPPITSSNAPVSGAGAAITLINANREFIQDAVVKYVDVGYPLFVYGKASCYRDVGYMLDALIFDLTYNTNVSAVSAAKYYYDNAGVTLIPGQQSQTSAALKFANTLIQSIIINQVYPWYEQRFDLTKVNGGGAIAGIANSLNTVANIVRTGIIPSPTPYYVDPVAAADACALILINKPFIQKTVVQYVNKTFPGFTYNQELCERDAGFMLDAVIYDITNSTNASAIYAGSFYYRNGSSIIQGQEAQTAAAINYINFLTSKAVTNTVAVTSQSFNPYLSSGYLAKDYVEESFDTIKRIIITGEIPKNQQYDTLYDGGPASVYTNNLFKTVASVISTQGTIPPLEVYGAIPNGVDAASLLTLNKEFLQRLTLEYVQKLYPKLTFNKSLCYRDVGYIVDSVSYDLTNGTNLSSRAAGQKYYSNMNTFQYFNTVLTGGYQALSAIRGSIFTIVDTINSYGTVPSLKTYDNLPGLADAITLISNNKTFIQELTINYVNRTFPYLYYDRQLCYRDTGYIIDAVLYDLTNLSNASARYVASNYYYACQSTIEGQENATATALEFVNSVMQKIIINKQFPIPTNISGQEEPTVNAILFAANAASYVITNSAYPFYSQYYDLSKDGINSIPYASTAFTYISTIITNGIGSVTNSNYAVPADSSDAKYLLQKNKMFLQSEIIKYVNAEFPNLKYNIASCYRDVGYLVNAVCDDITDGNYLSSINAGNYYYTGGGQYINSIEYPSGADANSAVVTSLSTVSQTILENGAVQPSYSYTLTPAAIVDASALLQANKTYIQRLTIDFVNRSFASYGGTFKYDRDLCFRDVGYLIDAVITDLTAENNNKSLEAAAYYFNGSNSRIEGQQEQTAAAIGFASFLAQKIISNTIYQGTTKLTGQQKQTADAINHLNKIAQQVMVNEPVDSRVDAAALLELNRTFIQKEVIQYVNKVYPTFTYNRDLCERDVGFILDAVIYDVLHGTTLSAIDAGAAYFNGNTSRIPGQEVETAMAINYAKYLAVQIIENIPVRRIGAGCGIRVDGELALGFTRSFVTDSFTQYNQGGKGIHIINCGYAQLVSTFTICTSEGVICESGGNCSISTSNCSFGLSGLVATGKSKFAVLTGYQVDTTPLSNNTLIIRGVTPRPLSAFIDAIQRGINKEGIPIESPYNGLLVNVQGDPASEYDDFFNPESLPKYHGIANVETLPQPEYPPYSYRLTLEQNVTAPLSASPMEPKYVEFYLRSTIASSSHAFEYIGTGTDLELAVPALGGRPINDNEAVFADNGIVYYSSTNERGDFKVGSGFTIVQERGSVVGTSFDKSILALVTPLILSLS